MGRLRKKFDFLASLSARFPDSQKPILVGGSAVEFYTRGISKSIDLDLVAERSLLIPIFQKMEFKQSGRHFHKGRIHIEVPSNTLHGRSKIVNYRRKKIRIISVEDLIVDRLCACKFWRSEYDCEQARMLLRAYKTKLDWQYLRNRAEAEGVEI